MPLMTSLYTGVTGLTANQNALNITAHNLANVATEGYVRQQASMVDGIYSNLGYSGVNTKQLGLGVVSAETNHYRDQLLDKSYREQYGRENFYSAKYTASVEVETILGELEGVQFQESLKDLKEAINEMAKTPDSTVARAELLMNAQAFLTRASAVYSEMVSYQNTLDKKISDMVDTINNIGEQIFQLNLKISSVESADVEKASDLRDRRDMLVDELSRYVKIDTSEDENGILTIRVENTSFVVKDGVFKMGTAMLYGDKESTYVSPVWPHIDDAPVFNVYEETSTAKNNDIGELKGLLIARGNYSATYKDIPHEPDYSQYATDAEKVAAFDQYQKDVQEYEENVGRTVITKAEALFDQLVNNIISTINDILSPTIEKTMTSTVTLTIPAGTVVNTLDDTIKEKLAGATKDSKGALVGDTQVTLVAGDKITILNEGEDENSCSYGVDANQTPGSELFTRNEVERYTVAKGSDGKTYYIYNPYNEFGSESLYTLDNVKINPAVEDDYSLLPFTTANEDIDMERAKKILDAWDAPSLNLDPDNATPKDFDDYYSAMVGVLSNEGYIYNAVAESQSAVVLDLNNKRGAITGVSEEEELSNMIKFKNAYDASSRYITTVADMLDTLINRVGVH